MSDRAKEERRRVARALVWIVEALREHGVPYQVVGGLAARAYGARRPLADIDMYVPFDRAAGLFRNIQGFVTRGPEHFVDDVWDLTFLKANYRGQRIELGDSSTNPLFFAAKDGRWEKQRIDYASSTNLEVFGVEVEVMPKDELIRYKSSLGRGVDLVDVDQMTGGRGGA